MKQFKYNLLQTAYLKECFNSLPIGSKVTIMGRYSDNGKRFYHVIQGDISFNPEEEHVIRSVPEDIISERPPYETLYAIRTEIYYRHSRSESRNDIYSIKYVLGNLDTAKIEFYCEVDKCLVMIDREVKYGKVSLYVPIIRENGTVSYSADEVISQKFFFE